MSIINDLGSIFFCVLKLDKTIDFAVSKAQDITAFTSNFPSLSTTLLNRSGVDFVGYGSVKSL